MTGQEWAALLGIVGVAGQVAGLLWLGRSVARWRPTKNATVRMDSPLAERIARSAQESVEQLWPQFIGAMKRQPGYWVTLAGTVVLLIAAVIQANVVF